MEILRDAGLSGLIESPRLETLAEGFEFTEGPLWLPDGSILFQDIKAERTYRLTRDRAVEVFREQTGAANGQTFAPDGRIVFCEQNGRRVSLMAVADGKPETLVELLPGSKRVNSPNDVVCRSDGSIYFTDPPYGVAPENREVSVQGVYRWTPSSGPVEILNDFEKPNGLAFSPDEQTLYVCDTGEYHVRSFRIQPDGFVEPGSGRIFAKLDPTEPGGPDGVKVDAEGRVFVAVAQGIWVFDSEGRLLGIVPTPKRPSNLNWCDADARGLVITAVDAIHYVRFHGPGVPPVFLPRA